MAPDRPAIPWLAWITCSVKRGLSPRPRLERELLVNPVVEASAQRLFGQPVGGRRPLREMGGAGLDRGGEVGIGNRLPDHPPCRGLLSGDRLGKEHRAHRPGEAYLARQPVGAARIGDQPDAGERLDEDRRVRRDDDVRRQRQVCPGPAAGPLTAAMVGTGHS